jgi:hypothetical protein
MINYILDLLGYYYEEITMCQPPVLFAIILAGEEEVDVDKVPVPSSTFYVHAYIHYDFRTKLSISHYGLQLPHGVNP